MTANPHKMCTGPYTQFWTHFNCSLAGSISRTKHSQGVSSVLHPESCLAMGPRIDGNATPNWPEPKMIEAVSGKVKIVNSTNKSQFIRKNNHWCQLYLTSDADTSTFPDQRVSIVTVKTIKEGSIHTSLRCGLTRSWQNLAGGGSKEILRSCRP